MFEATGKTYFPEHERVAGAVGLGGSYSKLICDDNDFDAAVERGEVEQHQPSKPNQPDKMATSNRSHAVSSQHHGNNRAQKLQPPNLGYDQRTGETSISNALWDDPDSHRQGGSSMFAPKSESAFSHGSGHTKGSKGSKASQIPSNGNRSGIRDFGTHLRREAEGAGRKEGMHGSVPEKQYESKQDKYKSWMQNYLG